MDYEYIVIGQGIMGSAAAMHLVLSSNRVALIGPSETMADEHPGIPKSSHNDAGRITRMLDPDLFWGSVANRSIKRYDEIEKASGIRFFNQCGFLWLDDNPMRVDEMERLANDGGIAMEKLSNTQVKERFSFLSTQGVLSALYQARMSGSINPRAYVHAMSSLAQTRGAQQIHDIIVNIKQTSQGITLETFRNRCLTAEKILIATGAYGAVNSLVGRQMPLKAKKTGVVLIKVSPQAVKNEYANMPCIISRPLIGRPNTYLLPPLQYPDGHYYLKIGIATQGLSIDSEEDLNQWLRSGRDNDTACLLLKELSIIIPNLNLSKWHYVPCATSHTPDARPIIDMIDNGKIGLILGGNGFAAKSGDALGELGAELMLGREWSGAIPKMDLSLARFDQV